MLRAREILKALLEGVKIHDQKQDIKSYVLSLVPDKKEKFDDRLSIKREKEFIIPRKNMNAIISKKNTRKMLFVKACVIGNLKDVKINYQKNHDMRGPNLSIKYGHYNIMRFFIAKGVKFTHNIAERIELCAERGHLNLINYFFSNEIANVNHIHDRMIVKTVRIILKNYSNAKRNLEMDFGYNRKRYHSILKLLLDKKIYIEISNLLILHECVSDNDLRTFIILVNRVSSSDIAVGDNKIIELSLDKDINFLKIIIKKYSTGNLGLFLSKNANIFDKIIKLTLEHIPINNEYKNHTESIFGKILRSFIQLSDNNHLQELCDNIDLGKINGNHKGTFIKGIKQFLEIYNNDNIEKNYFSILRHCIKKNKLELLRLIVPKYIEENDYLMNGIKTYNFIHDKIRDFVKIKKTNIFNAYVKYINLDK